MTQSAKCSLTVVSDNEFALPKVETKRREVRAAEIPIHADEFSESSIPNLHVKEPMKTSDEGGG